MGVTVSEDVAKDTEFGPISPALTLIHPAVVIGHMTTDMRTDIHAVKVNVLQRSSGYSALATWVPFVQAAREEGEQNVEVVERQGQLYYVTTRHVTAGHELFVWYSDHYATLLDVPPLTDSRLAPVPDSSSYRCCACQETFRYPFSARAHLRFRCKKMSHDLPVTSLPSSQVTCDSASPGQDSTSSSSPVSVKDPARGHGNALKVKVDNNNTLTSLYAHSHTPADGLSPSYISPSSGDICRKRSLDLSPEEDDVTCVTKKMSVSHRHLSPGLSPDTRSCSSDEQDTGEKTVGSAFRKVTSLASPFSASSARQHHPSTLSPDSDYPPTPQATHPSLHFPLPPPVLDSLQSMLLAKSAPFAPLSMSRVPVPGDAMFPGKLPANIFALEGMQENIRKLLELGSAMDNTRPLAAPHLAGMGAGPGDRRFGVEGANRLRAILPFYRPANPMVEKMLQATVGGGVTGGVGGSVPFPPLNVSQNWCAKCNASFRMTSDLVYHMRSHHSREHDANAAAAAAARKRRDDKLRCEFCGETFRERHHLTRHMTSHTEVRQA